MKTAVALVGAVIAIAGVAVFAARDEGETYAITGTFQRVYEGYAHELVTYDECVDLEIESVEILDGDGTVVATGSTVPPVSVELVPTNSSEAAACVIDFTVDDIPRSDLYRVDVATVRGPSYTFQELDRRNFNVEIQQVASFEDV